MMPAAKKCGKSGNMRISRREGENVSGQTLVARQKQRGHRLCVGKLDGEAALYSPDGCIQQKSPKPRTHGCAPFHALQFLPDSPNFARDACDGSGYH